jgi:RNA polymerase sigma-70 factor, ECF subfamily
LEISRARVFFRRRGIKSLPGLNLFSPCAFNWMNMLDVAASEQLPVPQARAGDPAAWDALFRRYQMPLYVYIFELMRSEQTSLDLVQESFLAAVKHVGSLRDDRKFGSWLFGIAHQKCVQRWRKRGGWEILLDQIPDSPDQTENRPDDLLIQREQETEFMNLLNELPPPQRSVLLLHFVEDFSIEEIARITETQPGTVKSRLHYAKKSLRKLLEAKNENPV